MKEGPHKCIKVNPCPLCTPDFMCIESPDHYGSKFDMRCLVFAYWHKQVLVWRAVEDDIRGLEERVAKEAVRAEVAAFQVFDLFLVGGHALEPA